jgi:hypothetical protein
VLSLKFEVKEAIDWIGLINTWLPKTNGVGAGFIPARAATPTPFENDKANRQNEVNHDSC